MYNKPLSKLKLYSSRFFFVYAALRIRAHNNDFKKCTIHTSDKYEKNYTKTVVKTDCVYTPK